MNRRVVTLVLAILAKSSSITIAAAIGRHDREPARWLVERDAVAIRKLGRPVKRLFITGPLKYDLPLTRCTAGYAYQESSVVQNHLVHKTLIRCTQL